MPKKTPEQRARRLERTQMLLSQGFPYEIICRKLADEYAVSLRQASTYIREAREAWSKQPVVDLEDRRAQHIKRLELFVCEAMARGDCSSALRGIVEHARFLGIQPDIRVHVEQAVHDQDPERVRAYMAQLAAKVLNRQDDKAPHRAQGPQQAPGGVN